jgi:hypothetical protein
MRKKEILVERAPGLENASLVSEGNVRFMKKKLGQIEKQKRKKADLRSIENILRHRDLITVM